MTRLPGEYIHVKNGKKCANSATAGTDINNRDLADFALPTEKAGDKPAFFLNHRWPG
jgi:hypothetical protein